MKTVTTLGNVSNTRTKKKCFGEIQTPTFEMYESLKLDAKATMIEALIPLGLMMVRDLLEEEVTELVGVPYSREHRPAGYARYGSNPGSVSLAGQRLRIKIPRVRDLNDKREIQLTSLVNIHEQGQHHTETLLKRVLWGLSCRNYADAAEALPGALGLSASTISRKFKETSERELKKLNTRDLSDEDFIGIVLDGKSCAKELMLIAIGINLEGKKIPLGIAQIGTENTRAVTEFLTNIKARGFTSSAGLLAIIDGSKGLCAAVKKAFHHEVVIQRCQWHKRENVVSYLPVSEQEIWRKRLQAAYQKPTHTDARNALNAIGKELALKNQSALASLDEGLEETLTLHRLGLFQELGFSLKTTNSIESVNSLIEKSCGKVNYYKNSSQRLRWYAAALLDIEPRLHRINGHEHLPKLRQALQTELKISDTMLAKTA